MYIYDVYINTHTYSIYFENIYMFIHLYIHIIIFYNIYICLHVCICMCMYVQWGKKVFSQLPIVQVLPLKKMREACNFHHRYTSTMRDKIRKKNPENHIVGFITNLLANYGGK